MENLLRTHSHYMLQFMVTWNFLKAKRTFAERIRLIVIFSLHFFFFSFDAQHIFNSTFLHATDCTEWVKWWAQNFNEQCTIIPSSKKLPFHAKIFIFAHCVSLFFVFVLVFNEMKNAHFQWNSNQFTTMVFEKCINF